MRFSRVFLRLGRAFRHPARPENRAEPANGRNKIERVRISEKAVTELIKSGSIYIALSLPRLQVKRI